MFISNYLHKNEISFNMMYMYSTQYIHILHIYIQPTSVKNTYIFCYMFRNLVLNKYDLCLQKIKDNNFQPNFVFRRFFVKFNVIQKK